MVANRVALSVVFVIVAGCTSSVSQVVIPVYSGRTVTEPSQVARDERECAVYGDARPPETRLAAYIACMVSRGYRTYTPLAGRGGVIGVTVQGGTNEGPEPVLHALAACAAKAGGKIEPPAAGGLFVGLPTAIAAKVSYEGPFIDCMQSSGYVAEPWIAR